MYKVMPYDAWIDSHINDKMPTLYRICSTEIFQCVLKLQYWNNSVCIGVYWNCSNEIFQCLPLQHCTEIFQCLPVCTKIFQCPPLQHYKFCLGQFRNISVPTGVYRNISVSTTRTLLIFPRVHMMPRVHIHHNPSSKSMYSNVHAIHWD